MSFLFCISLLIPCQALGREKKFPATLRRFTTKPLILLSIALESRESSRSFPAGRENCDARTARSVSGGEAGDLSARGHRAEGPRASWPDRQEHRRRRSRRIRQYRRRGPLRLRGATRHGRAECRTAGDASHPFRMGANLGDVIVASDDIYGHGVNLAARLESLAAPGGVCISADALRHAGW